MIEQRTNAPSAATESHAERVRREFTKQAASFEDERLNTAFTSRLDWLLERAAPRREDVCLDVAAGTGHVARSLAPLVAHVVALDATRAMLDQGRRQAEQEGVRNVLFQDGEAAALPFLDESFDLVVSRFSLHHFDDPTMPLREMARVCRRGGRVVIADMVADPREQVAVVQDRLERRRDPSHTAMLSPRGLSGALAAAGLAVVLCDVREVERPVEQWLEQAGTAAPVAEEIRAFLRAEAAEEQPGAMRAQLRGDELWFTQTWAVAVGGPQA